MKKQLIILLILLAPSAFAVLTEYGSTYVDSLENINVYRLKYEPYPAQPGIYIDAWIKIQNSGDASRDVKFKLIPKYPFSLDAGENAERKIGILAAGETALIHYKIRVANDAVEGSSSLHYEIESDLRKEQSSLGIWIQTIDPDIMVSSVKTQRLVPGQETPVEIELQNIGDSPLTGIKISMDFSAATLPIVPVNSSSEKKVYMIEPKSSYPVVFNLMALPGASANTYKIPIFMKYADMTGVVYNKTGIIGLVVGADPDISITVASSKIYSKGDIGEVSLKVINKGLSDIKLANIKLKESPAYEILSESSVYLGSIDSDDYETAEYRIKAKKVKKGLMLLNAELDYLDANNNKYSEIRNIELKVVSAKKLGVSSKGGTAKIVLLIIVIAAGFFFYKRWEKKKLKR